MFISERFIPRYPLGFNYQAVVRDAQGAVISDQDVSLQISYTGSHDILVGNLFLSIKYLIV